LKALILLSHGSRRRESSQEMMALVKTASNLKHPPFDHVACAFGQFAQPGLDDTVDGLVAQGVTHIVVFPLFLAAGSHVLEDVPAMIQKARARHPAITMTMMPHLGQTPDLAPFLLAQATRHARKTPLTRWPPALVR
jgi:sirohydrochlorin ferrochelatase